MSVVNTEKNDDNNDRNDETDDNCGNDTKTLACSNSQTNAADVAAGKEEAQQQHEEQQNQHKNRSLCDFYSEQGIHLEDVLLQQTTRDNSSNNNSYNKNNNTCPEGLVQEDKEKKEEKRITLSHRFVRLNPRFDRQESLAILKSEVKKHIDITPSQPNHVRTCTTVHTTTTVDDSNDYPIAVPWLDLQWGFYAVPGSFPLGQSHSYQSARVYGQDVSSGAAVAALLTNRYDHQDNNNDNNDSEVSNHSCDNDHPDATFRVLDLCCAPGLKLCALADWLGTKTTAGIAQQQQQQSTKETSYTSSLSCKKRRIVELHGVDVSQTRLTLCKKVIHKYWIHPETQSGSQSSSSSHLAQQQNHNIHNTVNNSHHTAATVSVHDVHIQLYCNDGTVFAAAAASSDRRTKVTPRKGGDKDDNNNDDTALKKTRECQQPLYLFEPLNLIFDSTVAQEEEATKQNTSRKRMNKSAKARERKRLKQIMIQRQEHNQQQQQSSRILVSGGKNGSAGDCNGEQKVQQECHSLPLHSAAAAAIDDDDHPADHAEQKQNSRNHQSSVSSSSPLFLYDRVLVDAECSTDGSLKHVQKKLQKQQQQQLLVADANAPLQQPEEDSENKKNKNKSDSSSSSLIPMLTDPDELTNLTNLQRKLIASGFRLLRPGCPENCMIYSTCSLSQEQNEHVVQWLLDTFGEKHSNDDDDDDTCGVATLIPLDYRKFMVPRCSDGETTTKSSSSRVVQPGTIPGTVRFLPKFVLSSCSSMERQKGSCGNEEEEKRRNGIDNEDLYGGGFFLAKIGKQLKRKEKSNKNV